VGRIALRVLLALFVLVALGAIGVRLYFTDARVTAAVQNELKKRVPFAVEVRAVEFRLLSGVVLSDVRVGPPAPPMPRMFSRRTSFASAIAWPPLLRRRISVDTLLIDGPRVTLEAQRGEWNVVALGKAFGPAASQPSPAPPTARGQRISRFEIDLGGLEIRDLAAAVISTELEVSVDRVNLHAPACTPGDVGHADAKLAIGDGRQNREGQRPHRKKTKCGWSGARTRFARARRSMFADVAFDIGVAESRREFWRDSTSNRAYRLRGQANAKSGEPAREPVDQAARGWPSAVAHQRGRRCGISRRPNARSPPLALEVDLAALACAGSGKNAAGFAPAWKAARPPICRSPLIGRHSIQSARPLPPPLRRPPPPRFDWPDTSSGTTSKSDHAQAVVRGASGAID